MPKSQIEDLLILTKTYPNPSAKYRETTCVAALTREGEMRRIYPVPFRFLDGNHQFQKWEWIRASITHATDDRRPESFKIDTDSIQRSGKKIGTQDGWRERREWIDRHLVEGFEALETRRQQTGQTLGFIRPTRLLELIIKPEKYNDWTDEDRVKLMREGLFDSEAARRRAPLKKLPYSFYYAYETIGETGTITNRHMLTDWEVGALYWRCQRDYGAKWEDYFRKKLEQEFATKDLYFLMGTVHRFPDIWLIVGLVYPPASKNEPPHPQQLGFGF